jgi:hypothetical protein
MAMPLMTSQLVHVLNPSEYSNRAVKNKTQSKDTGKHESSPDPVNKNDSDSGDVQLKVNRDHVETAFL